MSGLLKRMLKNESGQSFVMLIIALPVLLGFAGLGIDLGHAHNVKQRLQNAADIAACAAAEKLPDAGQAVSAGKNSAAENGVSNENVTVNTPYNGDAELVEVICTENVSYIFTGLLGITDTDVSARAVAKMPSRVWDGESLPFVNTEDYDIGTNLHIWSKTGSGDFERMWKDEYDILYDRGTPYFITYYQDGVTIQKGVDASVKGVLDIICVENSVHYCFSLKNDPEILKKYNRLYNKEVFELEDLVLLKIRIESYSLKDIDVTVLEIYDINNGVFPTDNLHSVKGHASLIE